MTPEERQQIRVTWAFEELLSAYENQRAEIERLEKERDEAFRDRDIEAATLLEHKELYAEADDEACPCLHTTPCHPSCTCVTGGSSRGCARCCSYGSPAQQKAMAEYLVAREVREQQLVEALEPFAALAPGRDGSAISVTVSGAQIAKAKAALPQSRTEKEKDDEAWNDMQRNAGRS